MANYAEPRWNIIGNVIPVTMTLHILLGLFNKAFTEFTKTLDDLEKADLYREWVEKLNISRKSILVVCLKEIYLG